MGDIKNLEGKEAIEKIKEMANEIKSCLFCTNINAGKFDTRPMSTQDVDDEGNIWFLSDKNSDKNRDIQNDPNVQLLYTNSSNFNFMSVCGKAEAFYDREKIEQLWEPVAKAWMQGGKDDPNLSVIKLAPDGGYYWDNKHNKLVAMAKIAAALVSGKTMDDGIEGSLRP